MDNRNFYIVGLVVVALLSFSLLVSRLWRKSATHSSKSSNNLLVPKTDKPSKSIGNTYGSGPFPSSGSGVPPEVVQEMTKAREALLKDQIEMEKVGTAWLKKFLDDPAVSTITREIYRARNNPNVQNGFAMIYQGDFLNAKEEFLKAYNDPNTSPAIKYTCLNFLMSIALQEKNSEEYFQFGIAKGELLAKEDLSCLDQEKSDYYLNVIKEKQTYFRARENPAMQKVIADYLLTKLPGTATQKDREWAEREVKIRMKSVEKEIYQ